MNQNHEMTFAPRDWIGPLGRLVGVAALAIGAVWAAETRLMKDVAPLEGRRFSIGANGLCADSSGQRGLNAGVVGECGDLKLKTLGSVSYKGWSARGSRWQLLKLDRSDFTGADLSTLDGRGLNAEFTNFSRARLLRSDLRGLKSFQSNWQGTDFREADLRGARFYRDRLIGCDFRGADLREAILEVSTLQGSRFDARTKLPFSNATALAKGMVNDGDPATAPAF